MNLKPSISVIIPTFNSEKFVEDALESVLSQQLPPAEVIVVDDGSTDSTPTILAQYQQRITYLPQSNSGPAAARNRGIQAAQGAFIAFLDADDCWFPNKLALQYQRLQAEPTLDVVLGRTQLLWETGAPPSTSRFHTQQGELIDIFGGFGCGLFRRSAFDQVGRLDESLRYGEDLDWFMRAREALLCMAMYGEVVLRYRQHQHNMTNDHQACRRYLLRVIRNSLLRRKQQGRAAPSAIPHWSSLMQKRY